MPCAAGQVNKAMHGEVIELILLENYQRASIQADFKLIWDHKSCSQESREILIEVPAFEFFNSSFPVVPFYVRKYTLPDLFLLNQILINGNIRKRQQVKNAQAVGRV